MWLCCCAVCECHLFNEEKKNIWNIWYQFTLVWINVFLFVPGVQRGCGGMLKPSDILIKRRPERKMVCMTDSCDRQSCLGPQFNCVKRIKLSSPHWDMTFGAGRRAEELRFGCNEAWQEQKGLIPAAPKQNQSKILAAPCNYHSL